MLMLAVGLAWPRGRLGCNLHPAAAAAGLVVVAAGAAAAASSFTVCAAAVDAAVAVADVVDTAATDLPRP